MCQGLGTAGTPELNRLSGAGLLRDFSEPLSPFKCALNFQERRKDMYQFPDCFATNPFSLGVSLRANNPLLISPCGDHKHKA